MMGLAAQHRQLPFVDIGILMLVLDWNMLRLLKAQLSRGLLLFTRSTACLRLRMVSAMMNHAVCVLHVTSNIYLASSLESLSKHFIVDSNLEHFWVELHRSLLDNK